jgi:hypothetical protein
MADPVEEFELYRKELLDALGGRDPLEVLRENLAVIDQIGARLDDEALRRSPAPGEWSALDTIRHLVDTELVYGVRIRMVVTQDKPVLVGYDQDAWTNRFQSSETTAAELISQLRVLRESNLAVYGSLSDEEFDRVGLHTERGEESARYMLELLGGHDIIHVRQIEAALA